MKSYDAFVSYSHAKDKKIARALQAVVQDIGRPWWQRRALRVFRDDTSLAATPNLWPAIVDALTRSRYLILLASPEAAKSIWVNKEVEHWLASKGVDQLLIGLCAGRLEWNEAAKSFKTHDEHPLPPALAGRFTSEPKWIDLTAYREGDERASKRNPDFLTRAADFAAAVHGVPKEDLLSDELRQQHRALATAWSAAAGLAALSVLAGAAWWQANVEKDRVEQLLVRGADRQAKLAELANSFRGKSGVPQKLIIDVLGEARALVTDLAAVGGERSALIAGQGRVLAELSKTLRAQGDIDGALADATAAIKLFERLGGSGETEVDWQTGLAASYDRLGDALMEKRKPSEAQAAYEKSLGVSRDRLRTAAYADSARRSIAVSHEKIGDALSAQGQTAAAAESYHKSLKDREQLSAANPKDALLKSGLLVSYSRVAPVLIRQGDTEAGLALQRKRLALAWDLAAGAPDNHDYQRDLSLAYRSVAGTLAAKGALAEALPLYRNDVETIETLARADPDRVEWQLDYLAGLDRLGGALLESAAGEEALDVFRKGAKSAEAAAAKNPKRTDLQHARALAIKKSGDALRDLKRPAEALDAYKASLAIRKAMKMDGKMPGEWLDATAQNFQFVSEVLLDMGDARGSFSAAEDHVTYIRALEIETAPKNEALARALGSEAWYGLFSQEASRSVDAANEAEKLLPQELWIKANRAHALMFAGRQDEARSDYSAYRGKTVANGKSWSAWVHDDFSALRKAGLVDPLMDEVETALKE